MKKDNRIIESLGNWFDKYTDSFFHKTDVQDRAVKLKIEHTHRVCENSKLLCESIGATDDIRLLSTITALFHDVGRFEQFNRFSTFSDRHSVNHAHLGIEIINSNRLFSMLKPAQAEFVINAINLHNTTEIPLTIIGDQLLLCNLIRDADKIDIYKIASDHYSNPDLMNNEIIGIGINGSSKATAEVCEAICNKKSVNYSYMKTLTDFKLVQLGWVYDLNFNKSFTLINDLRYYDIIMGHLPDHPEVRNAAGIIDSHFRNRLDIINKDKTL